LETPGLCEGAATTLAFSPGGTTLACGTIRGTIEIWDTVAGRRLSAWRGHAATVLSLAYSPDGRTLASGGINDAVRLWDVP
jgi:WD40 repeat protein